MARVLIFGAGMVGSVMALEMAQRVGDGVKAEWDVHLADANAGALKAAAEKIRRLTGRAIRTSVADLGDAKAVAKLVKGTPLVLGALSSAVAHRAMKAVIAALLRGA